MAVEVPSWRLIKIEDIDDDGNDEVVVLDDMSDKAFSQRHQRPEELEKEAYAALFLQPKDKEEEPPNKKAKETECPLPIEGIDLTKIKQEQPDWDLDTSVESPPAPIIVTPELHEEPKTNLANEVPPCEPSPPLSHVMPLAANSIPPVPIVANPHIEIIEELNLDPSWLNFLQSPAVIISTDEPFTMPYYPMTYYMPPPPM